MTKSLPLPDKATLRRSAAEARQRARPAVLPVKLPEADLRRLQHELEVHQIELEMQNEELQQARAATETALEEFTGLYDFAPTGYFTLRPDGTMAQLNLTGALLLGADRSALVGRDFSPFVLAPDAPVFRAFLRRVFAEGTAQTCELTLAATARGSLTVLLEGRRSETAETCQTVMVDVTARKKAESERQSSAAALRAVEDRFRALVTAGSDVLFRLNADWTMMLRLDGQNFLSDAKEPTATWLHDYFHAEDHSTVVTKSQHALQTKGLFELEVRVRRADSTTGWAYCRAVALLDTQGTILEWFGTARDITDRKAIEQALGTSKLAQEEYARTLETSVVDLRRAKGQAETAARHAVNAAERFRVLSEVVDLQVWTASPGGTLDYANKEFIDYFGGDVQYETAGAAWMRFIHEDEVLLATRAWERSLNTGSPFEFHFRLRGKSGEFRWFLSRAQALLGADSAIVRWVGANTDIDDLKKAQRTAEHASRAKDDFLSALSHELRMPLTPVLMTAAALRDDERLPSDARELLGMIERNIALEARLIDDLLDLTKIAHGKLQLRAQPCDAHYLIGLAVEIVREDASTKGITITSDLDAPHSGLTADPARFQQVVWNLVRNAVKFTPRGGKITVRTSQQTEANGETWLRLDVKDSGIGIDAARLDQIFQPFDQGGLRGQHQFGGVGLGLSISRAVVDLHHGRISARSEGLNTGATFVVELPGAIATDMVSGAGVSRTRPAIVPLRLLLVEDHQNTRETMARLLQRDGHHVVTAGSVAEALLAAAAETIDLVISDLGLPDGSGDDLMKKLRATYGLRGIALSGYGAEEDMVHSRAAGFVNHLVKPIAIDELRRMIATLGPASA